jgi:peptidyl-prolyl cis-trans isomerase A (cyclophilin A)
MNVLAMTLLIAVAQAVPAGETSQDAPAPGPKGPVVLLETSLGQIKLGLDADAAPISVRNFLGYVRGGHYDGTIFHRVIPDFMIQGGGYDASMSERPTMAPIKSEARNGLRNSRGTVAMARTQNPNSATSQFFINLKHNHPLDFGISGAGYAVFGEVLEGMDVVDKIAGVPTTTRGAHKAVPSVPIIIERVRELE